MAKHGKNLDIWSYERTGDLFIDRYFQKWQSLLGIGDTPSNKLCLSRSRGVVE